MREQKLHSQHLQVNMNGLARLKQQARLEKINKCYITQLYV